MITVERAMPGETQWAELSAPHMARYLAAAEHAKGLRVLDAGCGAGYGAALLKMAGASTVQAIDIDFEAVASARAQFGTGDVEYFVDDCEQLRHVAGPVDLICSFEALEHLAHPGQFLARASELLTPEGMLLVSTPDRRSTPPFVDGRPRNPFHIHEWYTEEFEALLTPYFAQVEIRVQVESIALQSRLQAVRALREGLMWSSPLLTLFWRKWPWSRRADRSWKKLSGLAAPSIADYPIIPRAVAPAYGTPWFNFAICRNSISPSASGARR
jgi:SAM-dependent methyltransferase